MSLRLAEDLPLYLRAVVFGSASIVFGAIWDISWHSSIGRESFWAYPHYPIYAGALAAALFSAAEIFKASFGVVATQPAVGRVVVFGLRGPLGAFLCCWGALAMLTSAPFDDWWHRAYGLDAEILSPPHTLLFMGATAIQLGAMVASVSHLNRNGRAGASAAIWVYLFSAAMLMCGLAILLSDFTSAVFMHSSVFYLVTCGLYPFFLGAISGSAPTSFAGTLAILIQISVFLLQLWVLPLFPAEPELGPVLNKVHQMIPLPFPPLMVVPALAAEWFSSRRPYSHLWTRVSAMGLVFFLTTLAVHWPLGRFLLSPSANNWLLAGHLHTYAAPPDSSVVRRVFHDWDGSDASFAAGLAVAALLSLLSSWLGVRLGDWLKKVIR